MLVTEVKRTRLRPVVIRPSWLLYLSNMPCEQETDNEKPLVMTEQYEMRRRHEIEIERTESPYRGFGRCNSHS